MNNNSNLSNDAVKYINEFDCILNRMIECMSNVELSDSISKNFIMQMIPHHRAAIEMCENLLKYTTNIPLQNVACNIIKEQTEGIENMQCIEDRCANLCNCSDDLCLYQKRFNSISKNMFSKMENSLRSNNINANFISEMIPHHRGAIEMCNNALCFEVCSGLKPILRRIISSQSRGIRQMQNIMRHINR